MSKKTVLQIAGGIALAIAGIFIFFKNVQVHELWDELLLAKWWIVLIIGALGPFSLWLRTLRWKLLLPEIPTAKKDSLFPVVMIGFMLNNIFPARLGEVGRAVLLWKRNGYTLVQSAGSLVVERVIDGLVLLSFFFVPVFLRNDLNGLMVYALIAFGLFCGIIASFFLYSRYPHVSMKMVERMAAFLPAKMDKKALRFSKELFDNLEWVSGGKKIFPICILSILIIFCQALSMLLLAGWSSGVGVLGSMFGASFAALGAAIPLSPGYIGTLHAVLLQGLSLLGVENRTAGAIAVLYHAIGYFTVTVIGLYYFFCTKVSVSEINEAGMKINREALQER